MASAAYQGEDTLTPFGNFAFLVTFPDSSTFKPMDGVDAKLFGGFQEISGLEAMMEHKVIKEGGRNYGTVMRAGPVTFGTVILKRGVISGHLWRWWAMFAGANERADALPTADYRADVMINLLGFPAPKPEKKKDDGGYHYEKNDSFLGGALKTQVKFDAYNSFSRKPAEKPPEPPAPEVKLGWKLRNAMPVKFRVGDLNAKGSEVAIEELHLVHEGLDMLGVMP
jgi:phage tail-like protein